MRHVKLGPGAEVEDALSALIEAAYADVRGRVGADTAHAGRFHGDGGEIYVPHSEVACDNFDILMPVCCHTNAGSLLTSHCGTFREQT